MTALRSTLLPVLLFAFFLLMIGSLTAYSQHQADIWYFGYGAGLDFRNGNPISLTDGKSNTLEGCASISSATDGRLLFYTDGVTVWNAQHQTMSNGTGLMGHWTSAQSALIVPFPGDSTHYYVFTAGAGPYATAPNNGVRYSIVDLTLDGGKGDITVKNKLLLGTATEMLNATQHCNSKDYWGWNLI